MNAKLPPDFPTHIDIGGIRYDVVCHDTKDGPHDYGEFDPFEFELKVDADADRTTQNIGLFHEWFHGWRRCKCGRENKGYRP